MQIEAKSFSAMGEATSTTTPLGHRIRTDEHGEKVVVVPIREYKEMLERLEDAEDIAIIDERLEWPNCAVGSYRGRRIRKILDVWL